MFHWCRIRDNTLGATGVIIDDGIFLIFAFIFKKRDDDVSIGLHLLIVSLTSARGPIVHVAIKLMDTFTHRDDISYYDPLRYLVNLFEFCSTKHRDTPQTLKYAFSEPSAAQSTQSKTCEKNPA